MKATSRTEVEGGAAGGSGSGRSAQDTPPFTSSDQSGQRSARASRAFGNVCVVCLQTPTDRAHLVDRSLAPDPDEDPLRTVFLCRRHHDEYDAHALDLLPHLVVRHRPEIARAVLVHPGAILGALERMTGCKWGPI
jgi:hypothetical protein